MNEYEAQALHAIHAWKTAERSWFGRASELAGRPFDLAGEAALRVPGAGKLLEQGIGGMVSLLNEAAHWSVRPDAIHEEYRRAGSVDVREGTDVQRLGLHAVDRVIGTLSVKYRTAAALEGTTAGMIGLPGIPADVIALTAVNLRAIGEYATYCGFDLASQREKLCALHIMSLASSRSRQGEGLALSQLARIAQDAAQRRAWDDLEKHVLATILQRVARALGARLTKAKMAQLLPAVGALVGGGFNARFTGRVCDVAYFLYRERFLAKKYGAEIIARASPDPRFARYPEEYEGQWR